jgi:site-specific recombinase XerD
MRLVPLLELYLKHRRYLLQGRSTCTLFLNRAGGEMSDQALGRLVGDITEEFVHHRVTPTAFRPIFAYHWLQRHPRDYTNLASILWEGLPAIKLRFDREYRLSRRARIFRL